MDDTFAPRRRHAQRFASAMLASWAVLAGWPAAALAQSTSAYRCDVAGQTTYQSTPCARGTSLDLDDRRSAAQRDAALAETQRQKQAGNELAASNLQRDKAQAALARSQASAARVRATPTSRPHAPRPVRQTSRARRR